MYKKLIGVISAISIFTAQSVYASDFNYDITEAPGYSDGIENLIPSYDEGEAVSAAGEAFFKHSINGYLVIGNKEGKHLSDMAESERLLVIPALSANGSPMLLEYIQSKEGRLQLLTEGGS